MEGGVFRQRNSGHAPPQNLFFPPDNWTKPSAFTKPWDCSLLAWSTLPTSSQPSSVFPFCYLWPDILLKFSLPPRCLAQQGFWQWPSCPHWSWWGTAALHFRVFHFHDPLSIPVQYHNPIINFWDHNITPWGETKSNQAIFDSYPCKAKESYDENKTKQRKKHPPHGSSYSKAHI